MGRNGMAALENKHKIFIVTRLAWYVEPSDILEQVKQEFGLKVTLAQLTVYNPRTKTGERLSAELRELFERERAKCLGEIEDEPLAYDKPRIRARAKLLKHKLVANNPKMQLEILDSIAKEAGGGFSNRREITGAGGKAIVIEDGSLTDQERAARITALLDSARARRDGCAPESAKPGD